MAVLQSFAVELPFGSVVSEDDQLLTLSREQAESLCKELGEALGMGTPGGAEIDAQAVLAAAYQLFEQGMQDQTQDEPAPGSVTMTPEQFLASQQVQGASGDPAPYHRNPGSGIGNG